ncbi:hypothetical protein [Aureispira anguillae]|uniref:Uncharacterized protein n=1 Tax=Aureispira anguillae TaxID=2864201 RepID=A0A916DT77_9BACT|nr:hypothetical protein [Aureispira anguillae]BDS12381.1 hypothetical protein AsAng_0031020 [Aureispira anguillae]
MKDNFQFALILGLFAYLIFLQQCKQGASSNHNQPFKADTTIIIDTILPAPVVVQLPRLPIPEPRIVYIDSSKNIIPSNAIDTTQHLVTKLYKDSLEDENLTLYYESLVQGELLKNKLDYKLKIPKLVTKTVQINTPVPVPSNGLFLNAGVGGNIHSFSSLTVGLQFVSKKGWALGYDYDLLQQAHQIKLGVRIFPFSKRKK